MLKQAGDRESMETASEAQVQLQEKADSSTSATMPWVKLAWFSVILVGIYFPILRKLVDQWMTDDDVSHGFFVPLVAGYVVWQRREKLLHLKSTAGGELFGDGKHRTMVGGAQRLPSLLGSAGHAVGVFSGGSADIVEQFPIHMRQVAGDDQVPVCGGMAQSGDQSPQRTDFGNGIGNRLRPQLLCSNDSNEGNVADGVFHLAANADIKDGWQHPRKDLEQNTIATFNVLEAMRANQVKRIAFSSTGSVYGEALVTPEKPTPETDAFPVQTSLYGASKTAGEGLLAAYAEGAQIDEAYIFRFVSILGERYTHGHVFDFYRKLRDDPSTLEVLGNGKQRKSYLYIQDCIDAILIAIERAEGKVNIFNLGQNEYCEVNQSIGWISERLGISPKLAYTGGERGWIGDNPFIFLDTKKIQATGWKPKLTIAQGIVQTLRWLEANRWVYEARH